jgi:DnaK suppressor protein
MTKSEKTKLRKEVGKLLAELESDLAYLAEVTKPIAPENAIGRISRMDAINNMNINKSLMQSKQEQKLHYMQLLDKLESSDFGICIRCRGDIPYLRILRVPQSTICVNCIKDMRS